MSRSRGGATLLLSVALAGLCPNAAVAQSYPRVHVVALSQHADRATVAPGGVFAVTIHVKIAQRRERLDELILGTFVNCEIISNETVRATVPDGTDFVERLSVQALGPGDATISPAYIDALDPSIGKPMRFSSNAIRIHVTGGGAPFDSGLRALGETLGRVLLAAAIGLGGAAAIFVLGVIFLRRRKARPVAAVPQRVESPVVSAPAVTVAVSDRLTAACAAYRRERSIASLEAVRAILFELAGAGRGATLVDALDALGQRDRAVRFALLAAERAMFGPASERGAAGDEMLTAVQAYVERGAANADAWTH